MKPAQRKLIRELCTELPMIEDRLRRAGLLSTAIKMNEAVREIGYEADHLITKQGKPGCTTSEEKRDELPRT